MEYFDEFETLAREVQAERKSDEYYKKRTLEYKAESIMTDFRLWCRVNEQDSDDESVFKQYVKNKPHICFWIKKYIAEKHWNYNYTYDYEKKCWDAKKSFKKCLKVVDKQ